MIARKVREYIDLTVYVYQQAYLTNWEETVRLLDAFQFTAHHGNPVCPANWTQGQETIAESNPAVYFSSH